MWARQQAFPTFSHPTFEMEASCLPIPRTVTDSAYRPHRWVSNELGHYLILPRRAPLAVTFGDADPHEVAGHETVHLTPPGLTSFIIVAVNGSGELSNIVALLSRGIG